MINHQWNEKLSLDMYTTGATQAGEGLRHLEVDKAEHS